MRIEEAKMNVDRGIKESFAIFFLASRNRKSRKFFKVNAWGDNRESMNSKKISHI